MLKSNGSLKEKNVRFLLKRNKVESRLTEWIDKSTSVLKISFLIYMIKEGSQLDFKKFIIYLWF